MERERERRSGVWVVVLVLGGFFALSIFSLFVVMMARAGSHNHSSDGNLGVIEVRGEIKDSRRTLKDIHEFEDDNGIKAVVLRIDSPGGAVGPSQEIHDAIVRLRKKKKVVVSMGSLCASGGLYIAVAGDKLYANPGTLTGSIGVIMQHFNVEGVLKWANVQSDVIKTGKMKDIGSPFRAMTPEEKAYLESVIGDVYEQFLAAVAEGRHLDVKDVRPYADGRIFSGRQAQKLKLVDELGGFDAAVADAGKLAGLSGEPKLAYPHRKKDLLKQLMGSSDDDDEDAESFLHGATREMVDAVRAEASPSPAFKYELSIPGVN